MNAKMKSTVVKPDEESIANEFRNAMTGKLTSSQIEEGIKSLNESFHTFNKQVLAAAHTRYPAQCKVASTAARAQINISVNGGKSTIGDGGETYTSGDGTFWGDIYTDDINRLYRDSYIYQVSIAGCYMNVNFFDGNSNFLGAFQGGGIGTTSGTGVGRLTTPWH